MREAPKRGCMNTLIYKRTHKGDPDDKTRAFGVHDCMGSVRRWNFDAVIGVGGSHPWRGHEDIANKINWIGINPAKTKARKSQWRGPYVRFERFVLYDGNGPKLKTRAPKLFRYMFEDKHVRVVMSRSLASEMQGEITKILRLAKKQKTRQPLSETGLPNNQCCGKKRAKAKC
jgi:hypothetical protein